MLEHKASLLQKAVDQRPDDPALQYELATALAKSGKRDEAVAALRAALRADPTHYNALYVLAKQLLKQNDLDGALEACESSLRRVPGNTPALAVKSAVLVERGELDAARELLDFASFVRVMTPDIPAGFTDRDTFFSTLIEAIHANPALQFEPAGRTARGGSRADLAPDADQPEALVAGMMQTATDAYRQNLNNHDSHPFVAAAPRQSRLSLWTNVLQEGGYHTAHIHPGAWLSGVFYVSVPAGGPEFAGELELGTGSIIHRVCPQPGLLVLFPSYFYHRTIPTRSKEERISIAFDLVGV